MVTKPELILYMALASVSDQHTFQFLGIKPVPGIFMVLKKPREEPLSWPYHYSAMPVSAHPHPWIHTVYWSRFRPESPGPVSQRHHA